MGFPHRHFGFHRFRDHSRVDGRGTVGQIVVDRVAISAIRERVRGYAFEGKKCRRAGEEE
jgi:hypothetical protein